MLIEKITGIRRQAIKELREKHHIAELAQSCFEDILNHIKANPFATKYDFAFYCDDEDMQKYYQNDLMLQSNFLNLNLKEKDFIMFTLIILLVEKELFILNGKKEIIQ